MELFIRTNDGERKQLDTLQCQASEGGIIDLHEAFLSKGEDVHFSLGDVCPQGVDAQFIPIQSFLEKRIREKVLQLLQCIDLEGSERREFAVLICAAMFLLERIYPRV